MNSIAESTPSFITQEARSSHALMILGTASHVGKSIITAGLGRLFVDLGYRVAPFKAQNMSLNSAATPDGREIGRAQALQAEACRIPPSVDMNPVLIKPSSDSSSQIVVLGRVWRQLTAADYHLSQVEELFPVVLESYRKLASLYEIVLLEGAGSPAEINLREHDIVNMRMAHAAQASCVLVGDIDRGGVFASLVGTLELLEPPDRALIRGFIVNKFRGDQNLLDPGIKMAEDRLRIPCVGVIPYIRDLGLDEEDGVAIEDRATVQRSWRDAEMVSPDRTLRIGVVALPHMSNFTDFDALAAEPSISLAYLDRASDVQYADLLILPGSKQTLDDLNWLRQNGFEETIRAHHRKRKGVIGLCGGFQMLGNEIHDPEGIENNGRSTSSDGLKFLPVNTILTSEKTTRRVQGRLDQKSFCGFPLPTTPFEGYEIHVGETGYLPTAIPIAKIAREGVGNEADDGAISQDGFVLGTYVHGFFDNDQFRHHFIDSMRVSVGLSPVSRKANLTAEREARLNRLAEHLKSSLNVELMCSWLKLPANITNSARQ